MSLGYNSHSVPDLVNENGVWKEGLDLVDSGLGDLLARW